MHQNQSWASILRSNRASHTRAEDKIHNIDSPVLSKQTLFPWHRVWDERQSLPNNDSRAVAGTHHDDAQTPINWLELLKQFYTWRGRRDATHPPSIWREGVWVCTQCLPLNILDVSTCMCMHTCVNLHACLRRVVMRRVAQQSWLESDRSSNSSTSLLSIRAFSCTHAASWQPHMQCHGNQTCCVMATKHAVS